MVTDFTTSNQKSQKEDLANFISNISRDETPFMSMIGKTKATAFTHEWSTDSLQGAAINAKAESSTFAASDSPAVVRQSNSTQIFTKGIRVSGSLEAVDKAGRKSEFKYQTEKRGKEMMKDIEFACVATIQTNAANTANTAATRGRTGQGDFTAGNRIFGGYQSWVPAGNTVNGGGGAVTVAAGDGKTRATYAGAAGAFTLDHVDSVMEACYTAGGAPQTIMMSPRLKRAFSDLAVGTTNVRRNIDDSGKLRQSVEYYESDFGPLMVAKNYIMGTAEAGAGNDDNVLVFDKAMLSMATLRPLHHRDIREDGDSMRAYMVHECTLEAKNPNGLGVIGNLT